MRKLREIDKKKEKKRSGKVHFISRRPSPTLLEEAIRGPVSNRTTYLQPPRARISASDMIGSIRERVVDVTYRGYHRLMVYILLNLPVPLPAAGEYGLIWFPTISD